MEKSRRTFLKIAGGSAAGIALGAAALHASESAASIADAPEDALQENLSPDQNLPDPSSVKQWAMVINSKALADLKRLGAVAKACRKAHNIPVIENKNHEIKWIWKEPFHNAFPEMETQYLSEEVEHRPFPVLCNHCEKPPCVKACPTEATFKRKDGIVMMDYHRCIGCRFCMAGCPYGARSFNFKDPRPFIHDDEYNPQFPTRTKGVVEKCNFCAERISAGKMPACVEASRGAILFGDLGDSNSSVRKALRKHFTIRRKPSLGTEPSVYYII